MITGLLSLPWSRRNRASRGDCRFRYLAAAAMLFTAAGASADAAALREVQDFGTNPGNLRMYEYAPANPARPAPLVVALHGCAQNASAFGAQSGWTDLAERWGFILLLPDQRRRNNLSRCFNWFRKDDAARGRGEAASIKQMIDAVAIRHTIDPRAVFVTGVSAGGAMTSVLLAVYPDVFAGGAILAGIPYGCAQGLAGALRCVFRSRNRSPSEWGDAVRRAAGRDGPWPRVSIWQGADDSMVHPENATEIMEQWTNVHGIEQRPSKDEHAGNLSRAGFVNSRGVTLVELNMIEEMGHGVPVAPGSGAASCGRAGFFFPDVGVCSSYDIGKFWGLDSRARMAGRVPRPPAPTIHPS